MNPFLNDEFERYYQESPICLVDVGVRGGIHDRWRVCNRYFQVIGFEADENEFQKLISENPEPATYKYINSALHNKSQQMEFHHIRNPGCSSLLAPSAKFLAGFPESARYHVVDTTKISVTTLDEVLAGSDVLDVDFIKLDTQGTELYILQGAAETLSRSVFGVEVEVEFAELYEGQPLFSDVDKFLRGFGFMLFDLKAIHWKREIGRKIGGRKGQIISADVLYFKSPAEFLNRGSCAKSKLLKALTICVVYGFFDYALFLSSEALEQGVLEEEEYRLATATLKRPRHLSTLLPQFRGRDRIANMLYMLYDIVRSQYWGHSGHSGRNLGNTGDPILWG